MVMDVDLLRPGTVPMSPDAVLWFEFLLDKELLLKHLQKPSPDPTPAELITKFMNAIYDSTKNDPKKVDLDGSDSTSTCDSTDCSKYSLKIIALKILALKVAAYLKWNPISFMIMPFKMQISLMQDLLQFTNDELHIEIPNVPVCSEELPGPRLFGSVIYHRWFLGICMHRVFNTGQGRTNIEIPPSDEKEICTPEFIGKCFTFLNDCLTWTKIPPMLTYDCFIQMSEDSTDTKFDWSAAVPISRAEFCSQVHYDLAAFHFYKGDYDIASEHFVNSKRHMKEIENAVGFCCVDVETLESYLLACNKGPETKPSLMQQFSISIVNMYKDTLNILIQDNKYHEIPLMHRINLELDIQGALSSGKFTVARDLLPKIQALNAVRCIVSQYTAHQYDANGSKSIEFLIWATSAMWESANETHRRLIANYYMKLIIDQESESLLDKIINHETLQNMLSSGQVSRLKKAVAKSVDIPELLLNADWDFPEAKRNPNLEVRLLEQQIISCYNCGELKDLLLKLTMKNINRPVWKMNPQWELPIPLQSVVMSIQRGFLQDFSYVMLAKSRELMLAKNYVSSIEFLRILEGEVMANSSLIKLGRMIGWEILLIQISQLLDEWPAPHIDRQQLIQACENSMKSGESVIPRTEIMEMSTLCLLNLGRWDYYLSHFDKPCFFEIAAAVCVACQDVVKYKGNKKVTKELWDLVVPAFGISSTQSKRSSSGNTSHMHRDSPLSNSKVHFMAFLSKLRDSTALAVVISMFAKLYNILRDDGSLEINVDYIMLWPSSISNINSYTSGAVAEALTGLVLQGLKYYPTNIPWLRLLGDINYSNANYENSLKYYLQSLVVSSEYFNVAIRGEDHIFRRMIKCCTQLGCHTQAAVLCQFLDEPDYTLAFRSLVDFKSCNDSVEAYYHCFWDTNILEYLVHLHHKRGEFQRRKKAVQTIGLLELNSNNNEEIQREAINLRKRTFLEAMCKQYIR